MVNGCYSKLPLGTCQCFLKLIGISRATREEVKVIENSGMQGGNESPHALYQRDNSAERYASV